MLRKLKPKTVKVWTFAIYKGGKKQQVMPRGVAAQLHVLIVNR